nr:nickel transporter permease [Brevibacillus dissolubilis]
MAGFINRYAVWIGLGVWLLLAVMTLLGPYLIPHDPLAVDMGKRLQTADATHWLGTDHFGRDVLARLVAGAKITLGLTLVAISAALLIGVPLGLLSGYVGGVVDAAVMRVVDALVAFPDFIIAISIAGILGPDVTHVVIAIVLVKWIGYARVVRGTVMTEKGKAYVLAARVAGTPGVKTIFRHLLPQALPEVLVLAALDMGKIILMISALSYLGLGAQPPMPEWGAMLNDAKMMFQTHPVLMIYPGVAIFLVVLGCNLLGDGLRDRLDARGEW